jgi:hypothetical protein
MMDAQEVAALVKAAVEAAIAPLQEAMARIEVGIGSMQKDIQDLQTAQRTTEQGVAELMMRVRDLEGELKWAKRQRDDDANRGMRKNLLFYGVPKQGERESWDQCAAAVREVVERVMGKRVEASAIERAHRVAGHQADPPPIVALFASWREKEEILAKRREFKSAGFDVTNQYTYTTRAAMRHLIPLVEDARKAGKDARMSFNKAIIEGEVWVFDESTGEVGREADVFPRRRPRKGGKVDRRRKRFPSRSPEGAKGSPLRRPCLLKGTGPHGRGGSGAAGSQRRIGHYFSPSRGTPSSQVPQMDGEWTRVGGGFRRNDNYERGDGYGYDH